MYVKWNMRFKFEQKKVKYSKPARSVDWPSTLQAWTRVFLGQSQPPPNGQQPTGRDVRSNLRRQHNIAARLEIESDRIPAATGKPRRYARLHASAQLDKLLNFWLLLKRRPAQATLAHTRGSFEHPQDTLNSIFVTIISKSDWIYYLSYNVHFSH